MYINNCSNLKRKMLLKSFSGIDIVFWYWNLWLYFQNQELKCKDPNWDFLIFLTIEFREYTSSKARKSPPVYYYIIELLLAMVPLLQQPKEPWNKGSTHYKPAHYVARDFALRKHDGQPLFPKCEYRSKANFRSTRSQKLDCKFGAQQLKDVRFLRVSLDGVLNVADQRIAIMIRQ